MFGAWAPGRSLPSLQRQIVLEDSFGVWAVMTEKEDNRLRITDDGKTTTLLKLTENNSNLKFLLVVYNKSVRIQAESQFPKANVSCKTVHQIAMAKCGFMFGKKLTSNLKAKDILDSDLLVERGRAGQVLATLTSFMNSSDIEIYLEHVPSVWSASVFQIKPF